MITQRPDRQGIRITGPRISLVAAATPLTIFAFGNAARTGIIRKIHIFNLNPANSDVVIGTGTAPFVQGDMPPINTIAGFDRILTEEEILGAEFTNDITAQASVAAAAPDEIQIAIEVEVFEGE